ncbi:MAG: M48 family metallopeptidase [Promethearchaeota archaeon]
MQFTDISSLIDYILALGNLRILAGILFLVCLGTFLLEVNKYIRFRTHEDFLDLSLMGMMFFAIFFLTEDLILGVLALLLSMMIIGTWETRKNPIWFRLMAAFTLTYAWIFAFYSTSLLLGNEQILGLGWVLALWVLLGASFIFFGRRFIIVSRFMSPQYVYLVIYGLAYLILFQLRGLWPDITFTLDLTFLSSIIPGLTFTPIPLTLWDLRYFVLIICNIFIYFISGPILSLLFSIKTLDDERAKNLIKIAQDKLNVKIRHIGIVNAPILNAMAYGAWFDQRIAFMASDVGKYTDEELVGIAAHEMAHLRKKHTLLLVGIGFVEMVGRFILNQIFLAFGLGEFPANYYDYVFGDSSIPFWTYYLFNIMIFLVLVVFVRIMEGQSDRLTEEKGFGTELAQSLFRLEGYYQGIAGELGLNAQLLTGKERTQEETIRFTGESAQDLYYTLTRAPRYQLFMNLIMSHPLSAFRIAAILDKSITPLKSALLPWFLIIPGLRGRWVKRLQGLKGEVDKLLTEKYVKDFAEVEEYLETIWDRKILHKRLVGQNITAVPDFDEDPIVQGKVVDIRASKSIVTPIELLVQAETGEVPVLLGNYTVYFTDYEEKYFLKGGKTAVLKDIWKNKKGKFRGFVYEANGKTFKKKYIGLPFKRIPKKGDKILISTRGTVELATLTDIQEGTNFKEFEVAIDSYSVKNKKFKGRELVAILPSFYINWSEKYKERQMPLYEWLAENQIPIEVYDASDLEISKQGIIREFKEEGFSLQLTKETQEDIQYNELETIYLSEWILLFYIRREVSIITRISMRLFQRGRKLRRII